MRFAKYENPLIFLAILKRMGPVDDPGLPIDNPSHLALAVAKITEEEMGGSSGAVSSYIL